VEAHELWIAGFPHDAALCMSKLELLILLNLLHEMRQQLAYYWLISHEAWRTA
jgi:hypothetical protein